MDVYTLWLDGRIVDIDVMPPEPPIRWSPMGWYWLGLPRTDWGRYLMVCHGTDGRWSWEERIADGDGSAPGYEHPTRYTRRRDAIRAATRWWLHTHPEATS